MQDRLAGSAVLGIRVRLRGLVEGKDTVGVHTELARVDEPGEFGQAVSVRLDERLGREPDARARGPVGEAVGPSGRDADEQSPGAEDLQGAERGVGLGHADEVEDHVDALRHLFEGGDNRIKHVHLADNNRMLPGYGNIDWAGCIAALKSVGYDGYLNLECSTSGDPATTLPATSEFLTRLSR
jgi:hypothetical protein